jgi:quercetin dioxygenase-like cupin family protein
MRSLAICLLLLWPLSGLGAVATARTGVHYDNLQGEVLLDNPRVLVQKFVISPGQASGRHTHRGPQLLVILKGGTLTSAANGRSTLWRDGRVMWQDANEPADAGVSNRGTAPIELLWVSFKPYRASAAVRLAASTSDSHLIYPNIPGEDLFENDLIVVQRFDVEPGQWEGVHAHLPNMLYIHIKGGQWATRTYREPEHAYPDPSPDGEVGWMQTFALSDGHESGNIGSNPIDLIWVTLKR